MFRMSSRRTLKADHRNTSRIQSRKPLVFYSLYGWGIPLIIVAVSQVFQYAEALSKYAIRPDFHLEPRCWFSSNHFFHIAMFRYLVITHIFRQAFFNGFSLLWNSSHQPSAPLRLLVRPSYHLVFGKHPLLCVGRHRHVQRLQESRRQPATNPRVKENQQQI